MRGVVERKPERGTPTEFLLAVIFFASGNGLPSHKKSRLSHTPPASNLHNSFLRICGTASSPLPATVWLVVRHGCVCYSVLYEL